MAGELAKDIPDPSLLTLVQRAVLDAQEGAGVQTEGSYYAHYNPVGWSMLVGMLAVVLYQFGLRIEPDSRAVEQGYGVSQPIGARRPSFLGYVAL